MSWPRNTFLNGSQKLLRLSCSLVIFMPALFSAETTPLSALNLNTLQQQPSAYGIALILISLPLLLVGWWLIRWFSALSTAGAVGTAVLFTLIDRTAINWAWTAAISVGVLAGFFGWFLFSLIFTAQLIGLGWIAGFHVLQFAAPTIPLAALIAGSVGALFGGMLGWRLAPIAAIIQTVFIGFIGIVAGMLILCQPINFGERLLLSILVGLITIPAGAWVQWRSHHKPDIS